MRYAIYFTPPASDPLSRVAANWLGRNAFTGLATEPPAISGLNAAEIAYHTAVPRRYGFHGTLKAPFALADGRSEAELLRALMHVCGAMEPIEIPRLEIARLGSFFALTPATPVERLDRLAGDVVRGFDVFRAPLSEADIERRNPEKLSRGQFANLSRWGYPYVFEEFRFHMTLTGPVDSAEAARVRQALHDFFDPVLSEPVEVANLALFVEPEPGAPFTVHSLHPLGRTESRKTA